MSDRMWAYKSDLAFVESDCRVVLIDLERLEKPPVILEGSAAVIWQELAGQRTLDAVVRSVADSFSVEATAIHHDVEHFLEGLADRGLIQATLPAADQDDE